MPHSFYGYTAKVSRALYENHVQVQGGYAYCGFRAYAKMARDITISPTRVLDVLSRSVDAGHSIPYPGLPEEQ